MSTEALLKRVQELERPLRITKLDLAGWNADGNDPCLLGSLLTRCPSLTRLSLARMALTDDAICCLSTCFKFLQDTSGGQLVKLDLHGNKLSAACCETLARDFFPQVSVPVLESQGAAQSKPYCLDLSQNVSIGDAGAAALAKELKKQGCLGSLLLRDCGITPTGFASLAAAANYYVQLDLAKNQASNAAELNAFFSSLITATNLRALDLSDILKAESKMTPKDLSPEQLADFISHSLQGGASKLQRLSLAGNGLKGRGLQLIADAAHGPSGRLEELNLERNRLGDSWKSAEIRSLAELFAWHVPAPAEAVEAPQPFHGLRRCFLCGNNLDDAAAALLAEGLRQSVGLEVLGFAKNAIRDRGIVCLAEALKQQRELLTQLQEPLRQESGNPEQVHGAPRRCGVIKLDVRDNPVGDEGLEALAEVCTSFKPDQQTLWGPWGLVDLQLNGHQGTCRGAAAIGQAVQARVGLVRMLLQELASSQATREGGGAPPMLLRVDELPPPDPEDVATEASLARYWVESFGDAAWTASDEDEKHGGLSLEEELRALAAERFAEKKGRNVASADLTTSEDPEMVAEVPDDHEDGSPAAGFLGRLGAGKLFKPDETAPDALDDWYNDD